ncbi:MAG: DNA repair protein RecN [Corynebacterium sp.]|nr:DNA repair protein RecN [Corynebacterium sp.]
MLADIALENLGVIAEASVELSPGFTALTGETGAGKTMVLTGLRLLNGDRADASRVRTGAKQAHVSGIFDITPLDDASKQRAIAAVEEVGGSIEDGEVITTRNVSEKGRSKAYLGGRTAPAAALHTFSRELLTIHGQHDQLQLLQAEQQRQAVDGSDPKLAQVSRDYHQAYLAWKQRADELADLQASRRQRAQDVDRLRFAIDEIETIDPQPGEDTELVTEIRRLQDADALRAAMADAMACLDGAEAFGDYGSDAPGAVAQISQASTALAQSGDEQLAKLGEQLIHANELLNDVSAELGREFAALPTDPAQLDALLQRQQDLKTLTRKYAPDIAGVLQWRTKALAKLERLDVSPAALEEREREVAAAWEEVTKLGVELSKHRTKIAQALSERITTELHGLAMPKVRFAVALQPRELGPWGKEEISFTLQANPQAPAQPVAQAASGGELSRVMLALEVILTADTKGTTIVFDEIDAGVGGRAAVEIGRRLAKLATRHQVIVVTHLPQVAAFAHTHLLISKEVSEDQVRSQVTPLNREERVSELARMLAGLDDSDTGRAHAAELLSKAEAERGKPVS